MQREPAPCVDCGGQGAGRVLVCCQNYNMGRHGEPVCCDSPVWMIDGYCSTCGGSGFVEQEHGPKQVTHPEDV